VENHADFIFFMPVDRSNLTGVALVLLAGILWGAMGTSVQYLFSSGAFETPLELVTLRQLCAGSLFVLVMSLVRPRAIWRLWTDRRMVIDAAVSGALLFGAHNAFFESIYYSNAGTGAILLVTVPLWCGLWSAIVNRRPVPRLEIACFLLAAAGVSLIVTDGDFSGLVFSPMAIVWGLVSSFMAAAYNIQSKRLVARAGFLVLFGTMFAFWSFLAGLRHVSPVVAGLLNSAEPLAGYFFSMLFLGDVLGFWQTAGIALVIANVALLAFRKN